MNKVLCLPDIHFPFHDKKAMNAVESFMPDFNPDTLIYLGDQIDLKLVMDLWQGNIGEVREQSIIEEYKGFDEMMMRHIKLCKKPEVVFLEGNHEERARKLVQQQPLHRKSNIELERYFKFKERGIQFVPFNKVHKIGKVHFMHGIYWNQYHAKKHVDAYKRSVIYGHVHDRQVYTDISPFDVDDVHVAQSIGTLSNLNPEYKKNQPSRWVHGFAVVYIQDNGNFNDYFIKITKGKFIFGGKEYVNK